MLFANFIAELAHFPVCPLVAPIGMVVYKVDSVEDDVIMAMSFVDVGGDHILILAFQPFVGKLLSDFMRLFRRDFSDVEGLNQVSGNHLRHLHSLLGSEISRPLKFLCRRVACSTAERGNIELIVSLRRVEDVGKHRADRQSSLGRGCRQAPCLQFLGLA